MQPNDLIVAGLTSDIVGALFLSRGLIISRSDAVELGSPYIKGDERLHLQDPPLMRDRLRQSRNASAGLLFLSAGFCLQLFTRLLPAPQPAERPSGPQQLAAAEVGKLVLRDLTPAGDSVRGSVYNGTDRVVSTMIVELGIARYERFVLADPFDLNVPQHPLRTDLSRATRSYEVRVDAPPLAVREFAFPILDRADSLTGWRVLGARGYPPN